jgi:MFS family permease
MGYSISNTVVPLLSGPFFGRFGKWAGVTVIAATITAGIFVVWFGMLANNFWVVLLGRTIYGLGGESVFVGVDILVTKWFRGAEIGFAYGLIQAAGQAGSFTALYSVPALVEHFHCVIDNVCVRRRIFVLTQRMFAPIAFFYAFRAVFGPSSILRPLSPPQFRHVGGPVVHCARVPGHGAPD